MFLQQDIQGLWTTRENYRPQQLMRTIDHSKVFGVAWMAFEIPLQVVLLSNWLLFATVR